MIMKKVLLIEDNGALSKDITNRLEERGYDVIRAYSYNSALDRWDEDNGNFDAIVVDLQINPEGIKLNKIDNYGNFFGLAVIEYLNSEKDYSKKMIIYSAYVDDLKKSIRSGQYSFAKEIASISKGKNSISELLTMIDKITK